MKGATTIHPPIQAVLLFWDTERGIYGQEDVNLHHVTLRVKVLNYSDINQDTKWELTL